MRPWSLLTEWLNSLVTGVVRRVRRKLNLSGHVLVIALNCNALSISARMPFERLHT